MSVDLDWALLDEEIATTCQRFLNQAFQAAHRPSYLAEVACTEFSFGEIGPDVELIEIRDIWTDFLDADAEADAKEASFSDLSSSWRGGQESRQISPSIAQSVRSGYTRGGTTRPSLPSRSHTSPLMSHTYSPVGGMRHSPSLEAIDDTEEQLRGARSLSLQMHLRLAYSGALRLGIRTSLLVNHPAPGFLQLPINLVVTAVAFRGTLVVAFEGAKRRMHLSLLDPGPAPAGMGSPPGAGHRMRPSERVLTDMVCESEVGQVDKQILRNVGRVEKFVLEVVRAALEDEIIFPMFQTVAWGVAKM